MRRTTIVLIGFVAIAPLAPTPAAAQFSPQGVLNAITMPFRAVLGHLRHGRGHRHRPAHESAARTAPNAVVRSNLGWVGPLAWAGAYEDVIGYSFWPDDYGRRYGQHGFSDIVTTIVGPLDDLPAAPALAAKSAAAETNGAAGADTPSLCAQGKPARDDWPAARLRETVQITDTQRGTLEKLQAAVNSAVDAIKADCRDVTTLKPLERLAAMERDIWAVQNAGVLIRAPLKDFYDSLTEAQRAKFAAAVDEDGTTKSDQAPMGRRTQACAAQGADDSERLIKRIRQAVRPTPAQRPSLDALGKTAGQMQQLLMAACAKPVPATPLERLDAADNQLTAINYAGTTLEAALTAFYSGLGPEQKTKFDALGR